MTEFDQLRQDVLDTYATVHDLIADDLAETRLRLLAESRDRLAAGRYFVVVCGEFRRGKSSLLNALVERPGLFPVDVDVTTCAVVTLWWGDQESAVVYFAPTDPGDPDSAPAPERIPSERVAEFVTEQANARNYKHVLRVEVAAPIPQLQSGLVLVDTPGVGSVNPGHTAATRAFLPRADAVLFVASAVEALGVAELDFLKLALSRSPIVITAVTMIDRVVDAAPVVAEARARIAAVSGVDAADLVVVPVSSFRKRDAMEEESAELLAESGFPSLADEIWGGLAVSCGAAQVHAALDSMNDALAEAAAPIANELASLHGDWTEIDKELRAEQEKQRELKADARGWRRSLQADLDHAAYLVQRGLDSDLDEIRGEFGQALTTDEALADPNALVQRIAEEMVDAANRASRDLEAEMERLTEQYADITAMSLTASSLQHAVFQPRLGAPEPRRGGRPQGYSRFREMWFGGNAGLAVGAIVGSIVPVIGTVVGGLVGLVVGIFSGKRQHDRTAEERKRREYIADLRDNVLPKLDAGRRRLSQDLGSQVRDYGRALLGALDDEITAKGDSLAESVRRLAETKQRDAASRAARERSLIARQQKLTVMRGTLEVLRERTDNLGGEQR
jgi:Dynamin family